MLVINPGSPTFPRTAEGPTIARVMIEDGKVQDARIVRIEEDRGQEDRFSLAWLFGKR